MAALFAAYPGKGSDDGANPERVASIFSPFGAYVGCVSKAVSAVSGIRIRFYIKIPPNRITANAAADE